MEAIDDIDDATEFTINDLKASKDNTLTEQIQIKDTPFTAVRMGEKWFLAMGKYRLSKEVVNTYEECEAEATNTTWNRIIQVIQIIIENQPTK